MSGECLRRRYEDAAEGYALVRAEFRATRLAVVVLAVLTLHPRVLVRAQSIVFHNPNLTLTPVVEGLKDPTWVVGAPDGRLFVLERAGTARVVRAPDRQPDLSRHRARQHRRRR
jgi:hypothetical protein